MATIGQVPSNAAVAALKTQTGVDAKTLTLNGQALQHFAKDLAVHPMGAARASAFGNLILPILMGDAAKVLGGDATKMTVALERAVNGAGLEGPTLGLKSGEKGLAADTDYPPRAANASWDAFASALGISKEDAAKVTQLNEQIGSYPKAEGKYAPDFAALSPELQQLATNVSKSLLGENVKLSSTEQAFKANLVLNNLTWHMTNFERAAGDATRADPLARNNVFNTYSDNLQYASARGGLPAVIDMAISDSYNAGKPGVGKAQFNQPNYQSSFTAVKPQAQAVVNRLAGDIAPGAQVMVPQKDVF